MPETIRTRKSKIGFASPMIEWYKGPLREFVLDSINDQDFLQSSVWDGTMIRDFVEDSYLKKDYRNASESWQYIQAMILMRKFREKTLST